MRVSAQYAKEHFDELLPATEWDEVEIEQKGARSVLLTLVPKTTAATSLRPWGLAKGQIWMADDFNSPETSEELADLFEGEDDSDPELEK
jgi:hypothetical protein